MSSSHRPLILISNDDGVHARGIEALTDVARQFGDVVVVAPERGHSGQSHAITFTTPLFVRQIRHEQGLTVYSCSGTPVDSVKLALHKLLPRRPDFIFSGINHGSNSAASLIYSGTMAAAIEGCLSGIPSAGFSLADYNTHADLTLSRQSVERVIRQMLINGLPEGVCLNVNIPPVSPDEVQGVKVCRQTNGAWRENFDEREHAHGGKYYWMLGEFENAEPEAEDTDEWALANGYVAVVPVYVNLTHIPSIYHLQQWDF